ncbi:unnamed protein product [Parnassius apollo]|uniref:(apollo) hypothetical protein n=1 Tax=Parnassius apollo TaxID=110799 RepID=A0A8S3XPA0_PARAO|nr:unnamed protein product [Parnassius apollo]
MEILFKGKRVLVSGAGQGIGRGIAEQLWRTGAKVVAVSKKKSQLESLQNEYPLIDIVELDVADWSKTREIIDSLGHFDALVNNAAIAVCQPFLECTPESFDSYAALKDHTIYSASKAGLDAVTRAMALELGPYGIRVNAVNPTVIMTAMGRIGWSDPDKAKTMLSKIPLGRFGEVSEVVDAVLYLLSDKASMINGVELPIDGGFLAT